MYYSSKQLKKYSKYLSSLWPNNNIKICEMNYIDGIEICTNIGDRFCIFTYYLIDINDIVTYCINRILNFHIGDVANIKLFYEDNLIINYTRYYVGGDSGSICDILKTFYTIEDIITYHINLINKIITIEEILDYSIIFNYLNNLHYLNIDDDPKSLLNIKDLHIYMKNDFIDEKIDYLLDNNCGIPKYLAI